MPPALALGLGIRHQIVAIASLMNGFDEALSGPCWQGAPVGHDRLRTCNRGSAAPC